MAFRHLELMRQADDIHRRRFAVKPPWDAWYKTSRWQKRRAAQLQREPFCWRCKAENRLTPATIANHTTPHRGDPELFWHGALDSQCKRHHDSDQQRIEKGGKPTQPIGLDGWPEEVAGGS